MTPDIGDGGGTRRLLWTPVGLLVFGVMVIWLVEVVDQLLLDDRLQSHGIRPRHWEALDGILWAPFLHSDFGHVASNSVALLALGGLVAIRGMRYWAWVSALAVSGGGVLTWALAGDGNHIGASGLVFGYLGAILGAAAFERRPKALAPALLVIGFYSSVLVGLVPQESISWEGHLFGMVAGVAVSGWLAEPPPKGREGPDDPQSWEIDEPWLD